MLVAALAAWLLAPADASSQTPAARDLVERLSRMTSCTSPTFSADGSEIAFVSDITGTPQVWKVPVEGGWPTQVTALDDTVSSVEWSPDGAWLAVSAAPGGGMNSQVYLVSPDGLAVRRITAGGRETNLLGGWSDNGKLLALGANVRDPAALDAYLYDVAEGQTELVAENRGMGWIADLDRSGKRALISRLAGRGSNDLFLRELDSGAEIHLTPHEGPGSFAGELTWDGKTIYVASNKDRDTIAFGRVQVRGGEASEIEILRGRDDAELSSLALSPRGDQVALVWNVAGRSELELYDLRTEMSWPLDLPVDLVSGLEWSRRGERLAWVGSSANRPRNVYLLDPETGRSTQLTDCPHPGIDLAELVRPELVRYRSHDGLELSGWLYRPAGDESGPRPYVLSFHGGPEGQERPSLRADYQALLAQGIGVFAPNIRGSSGFGKRFVNLDNRELRFDANKDIEASARYLVEAGISSFVIQQVSIGE